MFSLVSSRASSQYKHVYNTDLLYTLLYICTTAEMFTFEVQMYYVQDFFFKKKRRLSSLRDAATSSLRLLLPVHYCRAVCRVFGLPYGIPVSNRGLPYYYTYDSSSSHHTETNSSPICILSLREEGESARPREGEDPYPKVMHCSS